MTAQPRRARIGRGRGRGRWHTSTVAGVDLSAFVVGSPAVGEIVVVPGLCVSSYLRPACRALADLGYRCWLVEPPGWPRSGRPTSPPRTLAELAAPVRTWLVGNGLTDVVLVGQSVGAQLAAHVAAAVPTRIRRLVLQGPVFDPALRTTPRALAAWACDLPRERPSLALHEVPEWCRVGPLRVRQVLRLALSDHLEDSLRGVGCPVLAVSGEHDPLGSPGWSQHLVTVSGGFVRVPGAPHSYAHARPREFAAVLHHLNGAGA